MTLPSHLTIKLGKWVWTTMWQQMMSRLAPRNTKGDYIRPASQFHHSLSTSENSPYPPENNRYYLYVGLSCPWAHRTLIVRALKGLEAVIPVIWVVAKATEGGWILEKPQGNVYTLAQAYQQWHPGYQGRATVPVFWDSHTKTIVNNESSEIIHLLNTQFNAWATYPNLDLYPADLQTEIDDLNEMIYTQINNGVYRCGLAQSQIAYEQAYDALFAALDTLEIRLSTRPYLCGDSLTLADVRLFPTLFRFDAVYYTLFKCDRQRIQDYPHLRDYTRRIYQLPGIAATCDLKKVRLDYYTNLFPLNPGGIVPKSDHIEKWLQEEQEIG